MTRREQEQQARRQYIMDAAATVFAKDGFENASMNEIAKLSEFTRKTLYQYFEDKADLFLAVLVQRYGKMSEDLGKTEYASANGLDVVRKSLDKQYAYFKAHEGTFHMLYDVGKVRMVADNPRIQEFLEIDQQVTDAIVKMVTLGQKDGSISTRQDALTTSLNLKFLTTSVFNQLATTGETYARHIGTSLDAFADGLFEMVIKAIKP